MQIKEYGNKVYLNEYEEAVERTLQVFYRDFGKKGSFDCEDCEICPFAVYDHPTGVMCQMQNLKNEIEIFLNCIKGE